MLSNIIVFALECCLSSRLVGALVEAVWNPKGLTEFRAGTGGTDRSATARRFPRDLAPSDTDIAGTQDALPDPAMVLGFGQAALATLMKFY